MSQTIMRTKLYSPPPRPGAVPRRRLFDRLQEGAGRKLSLLSAPAGFGKTTLVCNWLASTDQPAAWFSLDEGDNDLARFLAYVIAALQSVDERIGEAVTGVLDLPQLPPAESILAALSNDIGMLEKRVVLVLDDYHLIDAGPVNDAVNFLLEHNPPQLHLVITTREDPQLPLARFRARGQLTELRAADLRFTASEAASFLNESMGLALPANDIANLEVRTEGWIAGLQLAALSMQGRDDLSSFVRAFAGDDRYIVDYLVEEVLQRQPDHIRDFLLQTAILDRLTGPLCDAVIGRDDGTAILHALERANLFVVPLDDKRRWYRYHHLFADVLRTYAMEEDPAQVAVRHHRASDWFGQNGLQADAIRHALAAGDPIRAAGLIEMLALRLLGTSQEDQLWGWLKAIPEDLVRTMPVLSAYYGFASFSRAGLDAAEARFRDAERWLDEPDSGRIIVNEDAFRALPGTIAVGRAYRAGALGDVDGIVNYGCHALDVMPDDADLWGGAASAVVGIGYLTTGELERAYRYFHQGKTRLERAGYMQFQIVSVHVLADIRIAQGRLREAERIYEESLRLAVEHGDPTWGTTDIYVGLAELLVERNDLDPAVRYLHKSKEAGEHAGLMDTRHRWTVVMARIREAQGDLASALRLLDDAARLHVPGADPDLRPIAARKARIWLAQGKVTDALEWVRERNLSVDEPLTFLREFEHLTLARVLIARYEIERDERDIDDAHRLLDRLLAEAGERAGSAIEILVLQALASHAQGDLSGAISPLEHALTIAEPEGYVRVFVDHGRPMARLLTEATRRGIMPEYTAKLRAAFGDSVSPEEPPAPLQRLVEPLSPRELEVMRLIAHGHSNREIADRLFLALSTVKGHNREIFGKLGVQRRTEAVARARDLNLL